MVRSYQNNVCGEKHLFFSICIIHAYGVWKYFSLNVYLFHSPWCSNFPIFYAKCKVKKWDSFSQEFCSLHIVPPQNLCLLAVLDSSAVLQPFLLFSFYSANKCFPQDWTMGGFYGRERWSYFPLPVEKLMFHSVGYLIISLQSICFVMCALYVDKACIWEGTYVCMLQSMIISICYSIIRHRDNLPNES